MLECPEIRFLNLNILFFLRYFLDVCVNALQGLWIFFIFVCKKNVINLMLITAGLKKSTRSKVQARNANMRVI